MGWPRNEIKALKAQVGSRGVRKVIRLASQIPVRPLSPISEVELSRKFHTPLDVSALVARQRSERSNHAPLGSVRPSLDAMANNARPRQTRVR